ncbi:NUDIX hydrolase [Frankia sp. Cr1]|uniref:NUDIX hydrolase n=1 Tax=Frankia sp. Cr1 TaxID=3073931 RepID=UPI002AD39DC1|nr:NUDIX domain-containing protein [Frankia sp. Cr1]
MRGARHATASVFLLHQPAPGRRWMLGLIRHPRYDRWMLPGGHVEPRENPAQAALREVAEETGHTAALVAPPHQIPVPWGFGGDGETAVAMPWWIVEEPVGADRHPEPHIHVDHLYVGFVDLDVAVDPGEGQLPRRWFGAEELSGLDMFDGTRRLATDVLNQAAAGRLTAAGDAGPRPGRRRLHTRLWSPMGRVRR